jgi:anti-sigma factor RsiW
MERTECDRARERVSLELDGELSVHQAALLERHLASCTPCAAFADDVRRLTELLRAEPLEEAPRFAIPQRASAFQLSARVAAAIGSTAAAAVVAASVLSFDKPSTAHTPVVFEPVPSRMALNDPTEPATLGLRQAPSVLLARSRTEQGPLGVSRRGLVGSTPDAR